MGERRKNTGLVTSSHLGLSGLVVLTVASWELLIPWLYQLDAATASRAHWYPLSWVLFLPTFLVANHLLLLSFSRPWPMLLAGELNADEVRRLLERALAYPRRVYLLILLGGLALSVLVAAVQTVHWGTSPLVAVSLLLAAAAHALALAALAYAFLRLRAARLWRLGNELLPAQLPPANALKTILLGFLSLATAIWLLGGGQILVRLYRLAETGQTDISSRALTGRAVTCLGLSGVVVLALAVGLAILLGRDIQRRLSELADFLRRLAKAEDAGFSMGIALPGADELDELATAFNGLSQKNCENAVSIRQAALDAREADRRQVELISAVCHNLRTPLHSIIGFSQLLLEKSSGLAEEQQHNISAILRSSHHLLGLVDDVVDLTKMESGLLDLNRNRIELAGVVREALEAGALLGGQDIELHGELPDDLPPVWADETRLRQILLNLIGNAVKYAGRGTIRVKAEKKDTDFIQLTVEDDGPGLPVEYLERIFREFERAGRDSSATGTGLGLAITKQLVELHGGQIWAGNRPGGGASFTFSVPIWKGREGAA